MKKNKFIVTALVIVVMITGCSQLNNVKDDDSTKIAPDGQTEISIVNNETENTTEKIENTESTENSYNEQTNINKLKSIIGCDAENKNNYIKCKSSDGNHYTYYFKDNMYIRINECNPLYDDEQIGEYEITNNNSIKIQYDTVKIRVKEDKNKIDSLMNNITEYSSNLHKKISKLKQHVGYTKAEYSIETSKIDYNNYNLHYINTKPIINEISLLNKKDESDKIKMITSDNEDILIQFLGKTLNEVENKKYTKQKCNDKNKNTYNMMLTCYGCYNIDDDTILSLNEDNTFVSTYNYYVNNNCIVNSNKKDYIGKFETDNKTYITFKYNVVKRCKLTTEKRNEILSKIAQNKEEYKYIKTYKLKIDLKEYDNSTIGNNWICPDKRLTITRGNKKIQLISCANT